MSVRFRVASAALGVGALLLVLATAHAQTPLPTVAAGEEQKEGSGKEYLAELNLTPAQMEKLNAQRQANRSAVRELHRALRTKRGELRREMDKLNPDKAKIESITSELKSLEAQRIDQRVRIILQMKETLTPEQFKKLSALEEDFSTQLRAMRKLHQALKTKREELREELDKHNPDKAKLESITSELKSLEAQRIDLSVKISQMKETLPPR
jgi:Spy/CpxP family protein refolding chaperone